MSWNPGDDWRPPPPPIAEDMEDVQTSWGILPRWKARALALGEIQAVVNELHGGVTIRNDAVGVGASALHDEQKPPPLAADDVEVEAEVPVEVLAVIEEKINQLATRLDAYERRKAAEVALLELEDRIDSEMRAAGIDVDGDDDDAERILN
jgi:hypothetical protein